MKVSYPMRERLKEIRRGHWSGRPYECSNTNPTADALFKRGLIRRADDQSHAREMLCRAWVLTPAGAAEIGGYDL